MRTPPHSAEAEIALLGAILVWSDAWHEVSTLVDAGSFYKEAHRLIWTAFETCKARGLDIDTVTVCDTMSSTGTLKPSGGLHYLASLTSQVPTAANATYYAGIVAKHSSLRSAIDAGLRFVDSCYSDVADVDSLLTQFESRVVGVSGGTDCGHAIYEQDAVIRSAWKRIEAAAESSSALVGHATGLTALDSITGGYADGRLIVVAARPSMGKTAFALGNSKHVALNLLRTSGGCVLFASLEMTKEELGIRLLADEADVVGTDLERAKINDAEMKRVIHACSTLRLLPIRYMDSGDLSVSLIATRARRLHETRPVRMIVVDYLQLVHANTGVGSDESRIAKVSRSLKVLAKELSCPVLAVAQLNRGVEQRTDKRPLLSDLRGSGSIEQDADQVLLLYRDEYYNEETSEPGIAEIIIAKNRGGRTGTIKVSFDGPKMRFSN